MSFEGLRVLSLESRRAAEMATLIRNQMGEPIVAPSMREVPIVDNQAAFQFATALFAGSFDMVILLTGVGTRYLDKVLATQHPPEKFADALRQLNVIARGPKPMAVLREWKVPAILVPEPNTWREILDTIESTPGLRVAVQEYGKSNPELTAGLIAQGREVTTVPVYQWALPLDTQPLRQAAHLLANGEIEVVLFTTSIQLPHLLEIAEREGIAAEVAQWPLPRRARLHWPHHFGSSRRTGPASRPGTFPSQNGQSCPRNQPTRRRHFCLETACLKTLTT